MPNAIAYIRVSDQRQADDGGSLTTQERQVLAHAVSYGYQLVRIFREEGESAKTDQRPKLQELLDFCRQGKRAVDVLIVPKIDRLARNVYDYSNLKLTLQRIGVRLESVGERIEDNPVGRFTESILASVAQFDNEVRAERCKGGMVEAVNQGRWVWKAPIGYANVRHEGKGTIAPKQPEARLVAEAFGFLAYGHLDVTYVWNWLNERGVTVKRTQFYSMMSNPIYIGKIRAFGRTVDGKPPFVPLIDETTFYRAQAAIRPKASTKDHARIREDFPLRGTIRCSCGRFMTASWTTGRRRRYAYYRCTQCPRVNYSSDDVERALQVELNLYKPVPGAWERISQALVQVAEARADSGGESRQNLLARIAELKQTQKTISLKNATGVIPDDIAREQIQELAGQITELHSLLPQQQEPVNIDDLLSFAETYLNRLGTTWKQTDLEPKKNLLRFLFPEGIVYAPASGFGTAGNDFLERLKRELSTADFTLVDPEDQFWNMLHTCLLSLDSLRHNLLASYP